ncbi:hypothetical protein B0O99DRAFT_648611 [Bisporella sp. PMI_857]|nr:hypothetical protein B0O99DRAFT_648611 [Bisporella sp. PMI_857]
MTRDTQGLHGHNRDDDTFAALWATVPFPRIPVDAPKELRALTIDVDDPKRVYTIHRATRRHNFHILVERYIHQVRYGCQNPSCSTPTCLSCRKRVAAGAPIRRYNATSARALAVYLSSQDNPERGLCNNPVAKKPAPSANSPGPPGKQFGRDISPSDKLYQREILERLRNNEGSEKDTGTEGKIDTEPSKRSASPHKSNDSFQIDRSILDALDKPVTIDHKSFVQNIFNTVAFKMVEWLTPKNLESVAGKYAEIEQAKNSVQSASKRRDESDQSSERDKVGSGFVNDDQVTRSQNGHAVSPNSQFVDYTSQKLAISNEPEQQDVTPPNINHQPIPIRRSSSKSHPKSGIVRTSAPKEIVSISAAAKISEKKFHKSSTFQDRKSSPPVQRASQNGILIEPHSSKPCPESAKLITSTVSSSPKSNSDLSKERNVNEQKKPASKITSKESIEYQDNFGGLGFANKNTGLASTDTEILPQSLSHLPIEIINLICDILQTDGMAEKHSLHPQVVGEDLKRHPVDKKVLTRKHLNKRLSTCSSSLKIQWRLFIEQAIFDVIHKPESLLRSFSNEDRTLLDSQTMWYAMLRMTRVAPSLMFHALWIAAGSLFLPPDEVIIQSESLEDTALRKSRAVKALSFDDAARLFSISLHALIAAPPLVFGARHLANMSRIRSKGLILDGLEQTWLCLKYEDIFSDELALRLARRLFAAIAARRIFTTSLDIQNEVHRKEENEADIVQTVLDIFRIADLETPLALDFKDYERRHHEKRVPYLILDWARTVILQDWEGNAEIPTDGAFGGAIAMIAALYKNRKTLHLGDIHFQTEFFSDRLDPVEVPLEWFRFESNRRTAHLLDYPYLFTPASLITYFRAINYANMTDAYETAKSKKALMDMATASTHYNLTSTSVKTTLQEHLQIANSEFLVLKIRRTRILRDAFDSIFRREKRELRRPLKVRLVEEGVDEEGQDNGGVQQEFFRLAIAHALNPDSGAFTQDSVTKMSWFQPGSPEPLWKFELIGMIVSLAIYNGLALPVTFPKALYRKLLDEEVSELHHIADGWPVLERSLQQILEWDESDGSVEDIFSYTYEFSADQFGERISRDMTKSAHWPQFPEEATHLSNPADAPPVTNENRNSFVSDYIRWLTDISVRPQFQAFKTGFFSCIDRRSVKLFDAPILQSIVEGVQEIDMHEMIGITEYDGWDAQHRSIKDFWSIVEEYSNEQKKKLLEFVTASDRLPVGGMKNLVFNIYKNGVGDERLPSSSTCYGILQLPEYSSRDVMKQKLAIALENTEGFAFS